MPTILIVCAVIITVAIAVIAIVAITTMRHFENAADEFRKTSRVLRSTIAEAEVVARQFEELVGSFEHVVPPLQRAAARIEDLSDRAVRLSSAVLNEVEGPVRNTLAVITGVRTGARSLFSSFVRRASQPTTNGGYTHEQPDQSR